MGSEVVAARSSRTHERLSRLNVTEPSRRAALAKAEGLTNSMSGAWTGVLWRSEVILPTGGVVTAAMEAELRGAGLDCTDVRKVMLLVTQSINRLWRGGQLCPQKMGQEPSHRRNEH